MNAIKHHKKLSNILFTKLSVLLLSIPQLLSTFHFHVCILNRCPWILSPGKCSKIIPEMQNTLVQRTGSLINTQRVCVCEWGRTTSEERGSDSRQCQGGLQGAGCCWKHTLKAGEKVYWCTAVLQLEELEPSWWCSSSVWITKCTSLGSTPTCTSSGWTTSSLTRRSSPSFPLCSPS